ncbi:hypothetical protein SAMN05443292_0568 [Halpernia frigidisoli]|uniref:Uncharacterized protein n=1 Tax=Halpernia frigidisoli TaxID=1125876 RepID=A0A1I3DML0_9FLAO|nr:hypothetical protein SAMN05443292_0568 [Halpernia frigidisoli]
MIYNVQTFSNIRKDQIIKVVFASLIIFIGLNIII